MQIVIDIDDNLYTRLFDNGDIDAVDMLKACAAIRRGKSLPKGHGDLKDENDVKRELIEEYRNVDILKRCLDKAPTIIEGTEGKE